MPRPTPLASLLPTVFTADAAPPAPEPPASSRRRRLWELGAHAQCPVLGVCLPIAVLRRLVDKVLGGRAVADDYTLHCGAVADCQRRCAIAEAVQKELDRRNLLTLRRWSALKSPEALQQAWAAACDGRDLAGALWAVLTHPRCTPVLEQRVLADVHMIQHQVGVARQVDVQRFEALIDENAVLARELGAAQQRSARLADGQQRRIAAQEAEIVGLRARLIARDTALAAAHEELQALRGMPDGPEARRMLERDNEGLRACNASLTRRLQALGREVERLQRGDAAAEVRDDASRAAQPPAGITEDALAAAPALADRAVLCVGGRAGSVPAYRRLIERIGARFLHHDGGEEQAVAQLDARLAAADLVICQTGCIGHDAYWRVKDHCKRTGKRCVFVENPSPAGLRRALFALVPETPRCAAAAGAPEAAR